MSPHVNPDPFTGVRIEVSKYLTGAKTAFRQGDGPVLVSPAMYELLSKAETEAELKSLLSAIRVVQLPAPPSLYGPLPMTVRPFA